jgi:parvulin-like peptidyl-prolyl isomerase
MIRWLPLLALCLATPAPAEPDVQAVAARVGGEPIFLGELLEGAGSLALVGREHAGEQPGTRERLLERLITARLLARDGRDRRLDQTAAYRDDQRAFADPILAARYLEHLRGEQQVSEDEILRAWQGEQGATAAAPDAGQRGRIAQQLRDHRARARRDAEVERLRRAAAVVVQRAALDPTGDADRADATVVATVGDAPITWRRARAQLAPVAAAQRAAELDRLIAIHLLADAARRAGLDGEAGFRSMLDAFQQREMIALVREEIIRRDGLDAEGVRREYEAHRNRFTMPEERQVQQIVVATRGEAEAVVALLRAPPPGVSFYTVARDRSIEPHAAQTLGVVGWLTRDAAAAASLGAAFDLQPGEISAPIEGNGSVRVIRVLEVRAAETVPLDADTAERIRARWNDNRIRDHARRLAEERYRVELFPEVYRLPSAPGADPS